MLDNIKDILILKSVDKCIRDNNFDLAMQKLNYLADKEFRPSETFLKRGILCEKLLMFDDAYTDFSYIISHCVEKYYAYYERMKVNFEIGNYYQTILDAERVLLSTSEDFDAKRYKFLSQVYTDQKDEAAKYVLLLFENNKYKAIQFMFNETAKNIANDNLALALKVLNIIDVIDKDNPLKLLKEANIYGLAGEKEKEKTIFESIDSAFPKYFISRFKFVDMYDEKDIWEISFLLELKVFDKQNSFAYPMNILQGYKNYIMGHIIDAKESFEKAIKINPNKAEAYVLLAQTLQLMSGYNNPSLKNDAEDNYKKALAIYQQNNLTNKSEEMLRQIRHLNSSLSFK